MGLDYESLFRLDRRARREKKTRETKMAARPFFSRGFLSRHARRTKRKRV